MMSFTLLVWIVHGSLLVSSQQDYTLNLGVFFAINSTVLPTTGFLPALDIAIETVNNHTEVLKNLNGTSYTLNTIFNDSRCDAPTSLRGFIDQIFFEPTKIMLIGASCSVSTEPLAELSPYWNLVQISPSATSPRLAMSSIFSRFLRTVPSDSAILPGVAAVMQNFGWSRIALLTQTENLFTFFSTELRSYFEENDLRVTHEFQLSTSNNSVEQVVESLRNSPARIVFINMFAENALEVMCLAYQRGMMYPEYVYMFHNWYSNEWWSQSIPECTPDQIQEVLEFSLLIGHFPRIPDNMTNVTNVGNLTFEEYKIEYKRRLQEEYPENEPGTSDLFNDSVYVFDAVWTAALALHNASKAMSNQTLRDFDYNNGYISEVIYNQTLKTDFFGLSGRVRFNDIGDRYGFVRFLQYRRKSDAANITKVIFAQEVFNGSGLLYLPGESVDAVYPRGVPQDEEHVYISEALLILYTIFSCIGIMFACVLLGFNLIFRNRPYVSNSNPYVSSLIIVGAVVLYVTVILFGIDENITSYSVVNGFCQLRIWLSVIGFSLLFGTLFAKAWRIYYIFRHFKSNARKEINDLYLLLIVGVLILIDILFMISPTVIERSRLQRQNEELNSDDDNDGRLPMIIGVCDAETSLEWLSVLFVYKGIVLLAGLFVAFEARKVNLISLNESRFIAMSIYGAIIVSIALTPIGLLLENFPNAQYGIMGIMIILSVTIILGLVFVSKMYKLYNDRGGDALMEEKSDSDKQKSTDTVDYSDNAYKNKVETLNNEIYQLKDEIQQVKHRSKNGLGTGESVNSTNGVKPTQ